MRVHCEIISDFLCLKIFIKKVGENVKMMRVASAKKLVRGSKKTRISLGLSTETTAISLQYSGMNYASCQVLGQKKGSHREMKGK